MWSTYEPGIASVEYSTGPSHFRTTRVQQKTFPPSETYLPQAFTQYRAMITGLAPNTAYSYTALVNEEPIGEMIGGIFKTAGPGNFNFLVIGDSGQGTVGQRAVADRMSTEQVSFVMHTGDVAYYSGLFSQYKDFYFDYYRTIMGSVPFYAALGNHDSETDRARAYLALHSFPSENVPDADRNRYYSFDWGNVHFSIIDSTDSLEDAVNANGPMLRWLDTDLRSTRQFWRVAIVHFPPYATGRNRQTTSVALVRRYVVPILEKYGVQVVFSGDEHSYQRSRPIWRNEVKADGKGVVYYTSGGGGANLYEVDLQNPLIAAGKAEHHYLRVEVRGMQMLVRAIGSDGTEIDRHVVSPYPMIVPDASGGGPVTFYPVADGGRFIRITGHSLAAEEAYSCDFPPLQQLAGTSVTLNGQPLPLYYAANDQLYAELPAGIRGSAFLQVITVNGSTEIPVVIP